MYVFLIHSLHKLCFIFQFAHILSLGESFQFFLLLRNGKWFSSSFLHPSMSFLVCALFWLLKTWLIPLIELKDFTIAPIDVPVLDWQRIWWFWIKSWILPKQWRFMHQCISSWIIFTSWIYSVHSCS